MPRGTPSSKEPLLGSCLLRIQVTAQCTLDSFLDMLTWDCKEDRRSRYCLSPGTGPPFLLCHPRSSSNLSSGTQLDLGIEGLWCSTGSNHVLPLRPKALGTLDLPPVLQPRPRPVSWAHRGSSPGGGGWVFALMYNGVGGWLREEGSGGLLRLPTTWLAMERAAPHIPIVR